YYENGKLRVVSNFKNGEVDGESKGYYENGKLRVVSNFKNGKLEGQIKIYYESGQLKDILNYKNGLMEGEYKGYYESGSVKVVESYVNDEVDGKTRYYYENGKEDNRREELVTALEEYLIKGKDIVSVAEISVNECHIYIYYIDKSDDPEKIIEMPTKL